MARRKITTDAPGEAANDGHLRNKYAELARKYAGVVSNLEKRSTERVVSRFGWLGLQATGPAFALVRGSNIVLTNRRWKQLATGDGHWRRRSSTDRSRT